MKRVRAILLSMVAMSLCLAGSAAAKNTQDVVPATTTPARAGFAILVGDINGQQLYATFSGTMTGVNGELIGLVVHLGGQDSPIIVTDVVGSTQLTISQVDATGAGKFENVSGTSLVQSNHDSTTRPAQTFHVSPVDDPVNPLTMRMLNRQRSAFTRVLGDRTNVLYQSEDFSGTPWEQGGLTITDDDQLGPDGRNVADRVVAVDTAVRLHEIDQSYNGVANGIEYHAVWVRPRGAQQWITLTVFDDSDGWVQINFDIVNGLRGHVINGAGVTSQDMQVLDADIEPYPEGWYLMWAFVQGASETRRFTAIDLLETNVTAAAPNFAASTADGFWVHGWMVITGVERPLIPSPYIQSIAGSTRDTSTTNYVGDVHVRSIGPGTQNIGKVDVAAADFAAGSGSSPNTLVGLGASDIGVSGGTVLRQVTLLLKSNMTDAIKFSDDAVSGALVSAGLGLLVVNGQTKDDAVMARMTGTSFTTPAGVSGFAQHVIVVESPDKLIITQEFVLTIDTAIHAKGKAVGGLMILDFANVVSGRSGTIESILIRDRDGENANLVVNFFDNAYLPNADNDALAPTDAELDEFIGAIEIPSSNYISYVDNSAATEVSLGLAFALSGTGFYAQVHNAGNNATWTATDDLRVVVTIEVRK